MRNAGILLHISSLPSHQGIGTFGESAYRFIDFLESAGQSCWQMLPVGPTGFGDSPYQPFSAFAGNPYFIDCRILCRQGLLTQEELAPMEQLPCDHVDYGGVYREIFPLLRRAYSRFVPDEAYKGFAEMNEYWLWDYALYMALQRHFSYAPWNRWPEEIRRRHPDALSFWHDTLQDEISFWTFVQYQFFRQLTDLRRYAGEKGIDLIGDMPIYVSLDSADAWAHQDQLQLDGDGLPTAVAGCPPDAFSETGQLWGNPLYRWDVMAADRYDWWVKRITHWSAFFTKVRIDHFRGFESYYSIPAEAEDATGGHWETGPGMDLFREIFRHVPEDCLIAEDLGLITKEVEILLEETGLPGMSVLQFAFYEGSVSKYLPHNLKPHSVLYTGTHDNDTTVGWLESMGERDQRFLFDYLGLHHIFEAADRVLRTAYTSVCETVIIPMQDFLYLGSSCRMNTPAVAQGNWQWRMSGACCTPQLANEIYRRTQVAGRLPVPRTDVKGEESSCLTPSALI